jgi:peptidoglycan/xylan/chitin deacetylase (PgdA/CDA1 family)
MNKIILATITIVSSVFLMTSCSGLAATGGKSTATQQATQQGDNSKTKTKADINLSLKPNESGKIMVLMYHNIGSVESEFVRTPENFRKDLNTLYEKGYRPISLSDYVTGNINIEQGYTPVVITFDDGNKNNFEYLPDGTINKDSAVAILMDFHKKHKDFPLEATFFLTGDRPFGQKGMESKKVNFIIDNGMDIGNHTVDHPIFNSFTGDKIQQEIGAQAQYLKGLISKNNYKIDTIALPYGSRPKDKTLTKYLAAGSFNGVTYDNIAILNVGWNPGYSPYDVKFDPLSIPRVRSSEMKVDNVGLYNYLDYFDKNPQEKFISDGVAGIVTVPKGKEKLLNTSIKKEIYAY